MDKKTIFVTVYDSFIAKNILRTGVMRFLKEEYLRIVVLADHKKKALYQDIADDIPGQAEIIVEGVSTETATWLERLWIKVTTNIISSETLTIQLKGGPLSPRKNIFQIFLVKILRLIFDNPTGKKIVRAVDLWVFRQGPLGHLFRKYKPDAVFATNVFSVLDVECLREAKRRSVQTIGMVKSWDNVSSKGFIRQHPEKMIVHTHIIKHELQKYDDYPPEHVFVSGVPQYDSYFSHQGVSSKEEFFEKYRVDSSKKIILYLEPGLKLAPYGHENWQILDKAKKEKKLADEPEIVISAHPAYPVRDEVKKDLENISFIRIGHWLEDRKYKTWEFSHEMMIELMLLVKYSDVVVNIGSTMNIEAAIFNKPIINIAFDGLHSKNYNDSVRQYYDYTHLIPIVSSGGIKIARSPQELIDQINFSIKNPSWGTEGRQKIVQDQCVFTDGDSGKRVASYIINILHTK